VVDVVPDTPLPIQPAAPEPHLDLIGTPILWAAGADGSGAVVASLDTGVDGTHPALAGRQVPGSGSWFDPYGQWPDGPVDVSGHGTWTLGAAVATEGLGVAPGARWIAARAFDDSQTATLSALHRGFQWVLDPDGDPATDDAPDVLLAPWTFSVPGCREELRPDVVALRAAGILPVFAAGNDGPGPGSDRSPANYPEALAVGVSDDLDHVLDMSARGPSSCAGDETFPDVVAPGDDLRVPDLFGGYASPSGTSMAAGVVAGAAAVLSEAEPELTPEERIQAVLGGALDLAPSGIDPVSGSGRLDLSGALAFVEASRGFSVRVDPPVLQVAPDGEGVTRLEVAPSFGYLGRVKLHVVSTLPPGVGVWFGRRRIDVPGSTSVRVEVGEDVAPGVFRVRIRARDDLRRTFVRLRVEVNPYG
jgi:subtilisin family serine protease